MQYPGRRYGANHLSYAVLYDNDTKFYYVRDKSSTYHAEKILEGLKPARSHFGKSKMAALPSPISPHAFATMEPATPDLGYSASQPFLPGKVEYSPNIEYLSRRPTSTFSVETVGRKERAKVAVRGSLPWVELIVHTVAIGITAAAIWANYKKFFSQGLNLKLKSNEVVLLNTWQVASKAHEIVMVSSLSFIALHYMRRLLLGPLGLPFGLLNAPYTCGSITMLLQFRFWRHSFRRIRHAPYALLLCIICILSLFLGPFSAMTIIPRLGWYEIATPFGDQPGTIYIITEVAGYTSPWPKSLQESLFDRYCNGTSPLKLQFSDKCPAAGYLEIMTWWRSYVANGAEGGVVFEDRSNDAQRVVKTTALERTAGSLRGSITTSVSRTVMTAVGGLWSYIRRGGIESLSKISFPEFRIAPETAIYQPVVHVECETHIWDLGPNNTLPPPNFSFPVVDIGWNSGHLDPFNTSAEFTIWERIRQGRAPLVRAFSWLKDDRPDALSSLLGLGAFPISVKGGLSWAMVPCSIDARWTASDVYYQPTNVTQVSSNVTDDLKELHARDGITAEDFQRRYGLSDRPIDIQLDFAKLLDIETSIENVDTSPAMEVLLKDIPTFSEDGHGAGNFNLSLTGFDSLTAARDTFYAESMSRLLGVVITDALALPANSRSLVALDVSTNHSEASFIDLRANRDQGRFDINQSYTDLTFVQSKFFSFTFDARQYGYGYQINDTTTKVAIGVLMAYCGLVMVHVFSVLFMWSCGWYEHSSAWGDVGGLVALAVNSRPDDKLKGTSAGISNSSTWASIVSIRKSHENNLELKFTEKTGRGQWEHEKARRNSKYD